MREAIVVFPHSGLQNALTDSQRRWISRGRVQIKAVATEPLDVVLAAIGLPPLRSGQAALQYLGQTGQETDGWIAAADPISFEPRLRDIMALRIPPGQLANPDFESLVQSAQELLANGTTLQFESVAEHGYLKSTESMPTAKVSAATLHGFAPEEYLPRGDEGRSFHRIHSELQMLFHDHPVNLQRGEYGLPAINGLWIWGGGRLADADQLALPVLFGADPLFAGYWKRFGGVQKAWNDDIGESVRAVNGTSVFAVPGSSDSAFDDRALGILDQLGNLLKFRRITNLTMVFNNEVVSNIRWPDLVKFWRRSPAIFPEGGQHE